MDATHNPVVSFVIPTLNRKGYATRAVRSCLAQEDDDTRVEVIVLDSQSTDGSWEELTAEFSNDGRVKLIQNERGKGPTASWVDGASHVTGDAVTFVWSDDYIFPGFARSLLPAVLAGASFAFGQGLVRDVDTNSVPETTEFYTAVLDAPRACTGFLRGFDAELGYLPASPACALFASSAFDSWKEQVRNFSTANRLASQFLWKRAIGPDLLLFLIAASEHGQRGTAVAVGGPVCQFSSHPGSITVSSPSWLINIGYWLTRALWFGGEQPERVLDEPEEAEITARLLAHGILLACTTPRGGIDGIPRRRLALSVLTATWILIRHRRSRLRAVAVQLGWLTGRRAVSHAKAMAGRSAR